MKVLKKILIALLLLLTCFFICCGNNNDKPVTPDPTPVNPDPVDPDPVDPNPVDPDPVDPDPVNPTPVDKNKTNRYMLEEEENCFYFFWETQNVNEKLGGCGLIPDRYPSNGLASIASVGFGLGAFVVGAYKGYVTNEEAKARVNLTLDHIKDLDRVNGFFYHFYQEKAGLVASGSEVSNIDTAIFLCGALLAGQYFGGETLEKAYAIYDEVDWTWFVNPKTKNFYMSYNSDTKKFGGEWDVYAEHLMMFFLAAGSRTHPIEKQTYDAMKRNKGTFQGYTCINSWFGSIFTYQFSHAFIDFRNMVDDKGVNWFENSVNATYADYAYCQANPDNFVTFGPDQWGITACDTPTGYSGLLGTSPSGTGMDKKFSNDGTVAPCGAIGSIVFAPELVMPCFKNYSTLLNGALVGDYGYYDAFNFEGKKPWIATSVIGIDKGISILMIENFVSEIVWDTFIQLDFMDVAIERLGFTKTGDNNG